MTPQELNEFNDIAEWCKAHNDSWLTIYYVGSEKAWKVYVNPGRSMQIAKSYKSFADAVAACKIAVRWEPPTTLLQNIQTANNNMERIAEINRENTTVLIQDELDKFIESTLPKKRGRPKGSRNKPKVSVDEN